MSGRSFRLADLGPLLAVLFFSLYGLVAGWSAHALYDGGWFGRSTFPAGVRLPCKLDPGLSAEGAWPVGESLEEPADAAAWRVERRIEARRDRDGLIELTLRRRASARRSRIDFAFSDRLDLTFLPRSGAPPLVSARAAHLGGKEPAPPSAVRVVRGSVRACDDGAWIGSEDEGERAWILAFEVELRWGSDEARIEGRVLLHPEDLRAPR